MSEKKICKKASDNESSDCEEYVIPYEAACSPEFKKGCFIMEEESEKKFKEK
jgi:hypothetical protein